MERYDHDLAWHGHRIRDEYRGREELGAKASETKKRWTRKRMRQKRSRVGPR